MIEEIKESKDKAEFVPGSQQGEQLKALVPNGENNNFIYRSYKESQNFHEYHQHKDIQEYIYNAMVNSNYSQMFLSMEPIPVDSAIEIYFGIKDSIKKQFYVTSTVYILVSVMDALDVNMTRVITYLPVDERNVIRQELKLKNLIISKNNRSGELY